MLEENLQPQGEEPAAPPPAPASPDAGELARQLEHERNLRQQAERNAEVWYNRATQQQPAQQAPAPPAPVEESFDDVSLVDIVAENRTGDLRKIIAAEARKIAADAIKQGGYVSQKEAEGIATAKAQEYQAAAQLMQDYPDMQQENSPLRLEASRLLLEIESHPYYAQMPQIEQVRIATERAHNNLVRTGKLASPQQTPAPPADDRMQRIGAQQGGYGSGYGAPPVQQTDELTPGQRKAMEIYGVSEKAYKANINKIGQYIPGRAR